MKGSQAKFRELLGSAPVRHAMTLRFGDRSDPSQSHPAGLVSVWQAGRDQWKTATRPRLMP